MDVFIIVLAVIAFIGSIVFSYQLGVNHTAANRLSPTFIVNSLGKTVYLSPALLDIDLVGISADELTQLNPQFLLFLQKNSHHSFNYDYQSCYSNHSYSFVGQRIWYRGKRCWQITASLNLLNESLINRSMDSKALLHNIIQNIPDAIGMMNEDLVYEACNPAFVEALGISDPDELIGKKLEDVAAQDIAEKFAYSDRNVLETGRPFHIIDEVVDENGSKQWMEARKFAFTDHISNRKGLFIIARDITERELAKEKLNQAKDEFRRLSLIDGLTGIGNRRYFDESLEALWYEHYIRQVPMTIMFCDVDEFKRLNDTYGHSEGDKALIKVASALENVISNSNDKVFRIGGEEFAFLLSNADKNKANQIAEKIHQHVEALQFPHSSSQIKPTLSISVGVATLIPACPNSRVDTLDKVDKALYRAKLNGKNQTAYAA